MNRLALVASLFLLAAPSFAGFDRLFRDETMRIDYFHTGAAGEEIVALDSLAAGYVRGQPHPPGRRPRPRPLPRARVRCRVRRGDLSRGFDRYFGEWLTTGPAAAGVRRTYHESVLAPLPQRAGRFCARVRQKDGAMKEVFASEIDPAAFMVRRDPLAADPSWLTPPCTGDPHRRRHRHPRRGLHRGGGGQVPRRRGALRRVLLGHEPFRA